MLGPGRHAIMSVPLLRAHSHECGPTCGHGSEEKSADKLLKGPHGSEEKSADELLKGLPLRRGFSMEEKNPGLRRHFSTSPPAFSPKPLNNSVDELFINNQMWRNSVRMADPTFFDKTATSQAPRYLWIGCSDSRVPAEQICGLPPGSLFVHRNIANLVNNVDVSAMSVLQYAVTVLKVQHIVVCGHYNCGGINAAMQTMDHGSPLENWLRNIKDVYRIHRVELDSMTDITERQRRMVEYNVMEQSINVFKTRVVQQRRVETYKNLDQYGFVQPRVHPCVYDTATGELKRLDVKMHDVLKDLVSIYGLYSVNPGSSVEDPDDHVPWDGMGPSIVTP